MRIALLTYSTKPRGSVVHTLALAEALAERGRLVDAVQTIEAVSLRGLDGTAIAAYTLFVRGRLRVVEGRAAEGARDLRACGTSSRGLFTDNPEACPWRSTLALALAACHSPTQTPAPPTTPSTATGSRSTTTSARDRAQPSWRACGGGEIDLRGRRELLRVPSPTGRGTG